MMPGSKLHMLVLVVTAAAVANAVGPDLKARARLLRDLPMGFGGVDAIPPKERDREGCVMSETLQSGRSICTLVVHNRFLYSGILFPGLSST